MPGAVWNVDPDSDEGFWWSHAAECTREKSRQMVGLCVVGFVLGVDPSHKGVNSASKKSVYNFAKKTKTEFPRHLLVFRSGRRRSEEMIIDCFVDRRRLSFPFYKVTSF